MRFPRRVSVVEGARSIFLEGSREKCALLIHGFTGTPIGMRYIAEGLNEKGWTVHVPRLPGHGTSSEDFARSGARDWIRRSYDAFLDLKSTCEGKLYVGGLSMGGIIAVILGDLFEVERLALYAPAFYTVWQRYKPLVYLMSFFKEKKRKDIDIEEEDPAMRKLWQEYWIYNWYGRGREFFKVQSIGLRHLKSLRSKTLIIVSKKDTSVPIKVLDVMKGKMKVDPKVVILEKSGHVVTNDVEKDVVLKETLEWFES